MGLKKKVEDIAIAEGTRVAEEIGRALLNDVYSKVQPSSGLTKVVRQTSPNQYIIADAQTGNERTVTFTGDRLVGAGGYVIVDGDTCR